jgi:hypothetical protein
MPYDNGHLLLNYEEARDLINRYPASMPFIRKIVGSAEVKGIERYCLWIEDNALQDAIKFLIFMNASKSKKNKDCKSRQSGKLLASKPSIQRNAQC